MFCYIEWTNRDVMLQKMWKEEQEELLHHCDSLTTPSIKSENKIITDHHE